MKTHEKIKVGLIGCGKVGDFHARSFAANEKCEFCAVYDSDIKRTEQFAMRFGVQPCDSIEKMAEFGVKAVAICTPHPLHVDAAVRAANLGMHIIIEKPLASSLADCDAIIAATNQNGVIGATICQRRFYLPAMRVRKALDDGKLDRPILGTVTMLGWRDMAYYSSDPWRGKWKEEGGGVLVNQAPHQLDLLLWYMGEIEELVGVWDTLNHPGLEVEDTAVALIRFKNGALGNIIVSNSMNPALYGNVHVHGSNGASIGVQTDSGAMFIAGVTSIAAPPINDLWTIPGEVEKLATWQKEDSDSFNSVDYGVYYHECQIDDFLCAILDNRPPLVTLEDGRRTVELFTALYRSKRDRGFVKFPLVPEDQTDFDGRLPIFES